jgi:hypothetical protein
MLKLRTLRFIDIRFWLIYKVEELDKVKDEAN